MSRSQYRKRDFKLLEPYEGKLSRTVLRGERGSNASDLPDRPSDLAQRDGRAIRKGNKIAKLYADNKVDVIIYAVEKSLDSYKFNLLHNKQMFITQLKSGAMGARTIDEGSSDEKSGMNFSEYMAILSGNTDLLDKAKLEKKVVALEAERKAFNKDKHNSIYKMQTLKHDIMHNTTTTEKMQTDYNLFLERSTVDSDGNRLNPIKLNGIDSDDIKVIGAKLAEIAEKTRTNGEYKQIGELYGFKLLVKTESSFKDLFELTQNKFMVMGETAGENGVLIKYNYNNGNIAADPKLASMNFINALERIPQLIEQNIARGAKLVADEPILQRSIAGVWKKEDELKELKSEVAALERKIALSLKPVEQDSNIKQENVQEESQKQSMEIYRNFNTDDNSPIISNNNRVFGVRMKM